MPRVYTSPTRDAIVELLTREGPMTTTELAQALDMNPRTVGACIIHHRDKYGTKVFRISGYQRQVGVQGREAPLYDITPGRDAPRPAMNTLQDKKKIQERYRDKHRMLLRLRDRKRKGVRVNHFLDILGVKLPTSPREDV